MAKAPFLEDGPADRLPFAVASGLTKAQTSPVSGETNAGDFDATGFLRRQQGALASLFEGNVPREEIDGDPDLLDIVAAAFRQENIVGSALSSNSFAERLSPTPYSPAMTSQQVMSRLEKDGLTHQMHRFLGVKTEAQYEAIKADIERELEDRRLLAASGLRGTALQMAAGVLDLPTLLPAGWAVKAARGANAARIGALFGVTAGADASITELILQQTQQLRSAEESAANIGGSIVLGSVLGFGIGKVLAPEDAARVQGRMNETLDEAKAGFPQARSAGAAYLNQWQQMVERGLDRPDRLSSFGAFETLEAAGKLPGWLGENLRIPRFELERGLTRTEREIANLIANNPSISRANVEGIANPRSVESIMDEFTGEFAQAVREIEDLYRQNRSSYADFDAFDKEIAKAAALGDVHHDPVVAKAAQILRKRVWDKVLDRHVENGNWNREDMVPRNAHSYFPLVNDAEAIRARKEEYIDYYTNGFKRQLDEEFAAASRARDARQSDIEDARIALKGVRVRVPDGFGPNGKPRFKTEVRAKGKIGELLDTIKAEHEENIRAIRTSKDQERAQLEAEVKAERAILRAELEEELDRLKAERDAELEELRETFEEMTRGSVVGTDAEGKPVRAGAELNRDQLKRARAELMAAQSKVALQHERAVRAAERKHAPKLRAFTKKAEKDRKAITDKYARFEAEARAARDEAIQEAQAQIDAALAAVRAENAGPDPRVLRFRTDEDRWREAARLAENRYQKVTGNRRFMLEHEVDIGVSGYMKFRADPTWHATTMDKGFVKTNATDIAHHYVRKAGTDAAFGSVFKKTVRETDQDGKPLKDENGNYIEKTIGDFDLSEAKKRVKEEYEFLIQSAEPTPAAVRKANKIKDPAKREELLKQARADAEKLLVRKRDRALANIEALRRAAYGMDVEWSGSNSFSKSVEYVNTFNYVRLMGGTVLSSLADPINIAIANGFGNAIGYGIRPLLRDFQAAYKNANGDLRRLSRLANAVTEHEFNSTVAAMADLGNPFAKDSPGQNFIRNVSKIFSKTAGITFWNSFWRQVAYNTTQARLIDDSLKGWDQLSKAERAWLANLQIDKPMLSKIRTAYENQPGTKTSAGIPIGRFDEWTDKDAAGAFRAALGAESRNNVIMPSFSDLPVLAHSPMGRVLLQFRRHMIANQARLIGRNMQLARLDDEGKAAAVYTGLFGLAMMGAVIDATKHAMATTTITGASIDRHRSSFERIIDQWEKTPGTALYNALDRSGVFGVVFEGSNILDKIGLPSIRGTMSLVAQDDRGGRREAARFQNRSVLEAVGGPTVGLIEDAAKLGGLASQGIGSVIGLTEAPTLNRADYKKATRFIPWGNVPGIQQILNEGQRQVGNIYDWPDPK